MTMSNNVKCSEIKVSQRFYSVKNDASVGMLKIILIHLEIKSSII